MYNQHTRGMETTRHRSLVERGGRKALLETLHTYTQKKKYTYICIYIYTHKKKIYIYMYIYIETKTDIHESKRKNSST